MRYLSLAIGMTLSAALPCLAQETPLHKRVTVDYRAIPLADVVADIEGKAGLRIAAADGLLRNQDLVKYSAKEQEAGRVLTRILYPRGLGIETRAGSVSVVKRSVLEEFKAKPEQVFEFVEKPSVTRDGDRLLVSFETKAFCDVTVAIEDEQGRIVRHLASGVLGENAPEPFRWNARKQTVVWDGKNDQDEYVRDGDRLTVRVSLGLKPQFERTLYWSPYKRIAQMAPAIVATEDGVVVAERAGHDSVRLYDHEGRYLRTIYPFPAGKLEGLKGVDWVDLPGGQHVPAKNHWYGQTLLTSGDSVRAAGGIAMAGLRAASGIGARGGQLALAFERLNRVTTDGAAWGEGLTGGECGVAPANKSMAGQFTPDTFRIGPTSVAFSPDGKWVYLAGYSYQRERNCFMGVDTLHGVGRMPADGSKGVEPFLGSLKIREGDGTDPGKFINAASVDCDAKGRVYVADFMNDRVQVFSPDGNYLKSISVVKPAVVRVHRRNGEIYVFSWLVPSRQLLVEKGANWGPDPTLSHFGTFDDPKLLAKYDLTMFRKPVNPWHGTGQAHGLWATGEIDSWSDPAGGEGSRGGEGSQGGPTIWLGRECRNDNELAGIHGGDGGQITPWETCGVTLLREKGGKLEVVRDFGKETVGMAVRAKPPTNAIQKIVVNPVTGKLYVGEPDSGPTGKAFCSLLEIAPETGKIRVLELPFNPMEYAFDLDGNIYLRNTDMIARYALSSLREIPWDYGTERDKLGGDGGIGGRQATVVGALEIPAKWPVCYHQGGIGVSPKGYVVASCAYRAAGIGDGPSKWTWAMSDIKKNPYARGVSPYQVTIYPGRASNSVTPCLHIWDKHGKVVYQDAVPGVTQVDGVEIDKDLNLYFMHTPRRVVDGNPYPTVTSSTLMKTRPGVAKVFSSSSSDLAMSDEIRPKRPADLFRGMEGNMWAENADWFFGGVGFAAFNANNYCACWFSRFTLDYFARSIAPEPYQFSVAVLDSAGNLILRIGRCGNVDDGKPLVSDGGPANARSVGGDEVALFNACYVATHTDRRLFISDTGNGRILSVKLGYHATEKSLIPRR